MRNIRLTVFATGLTLIAGVGVALAQPAPWNPPAESARCPSKWGTGDQRGSANHMSDPKIVLGAAELIRTGKVIELGHLLGPSTPIITGRVFDVVTKRTNPPPLGSRNNRYSNEELVVAELGQVGTQLDGLAHNSIGDFYYNCFHINDIAARDGFRKLGVENVGTIFTRGVLIDVAALKKVDILGDHYEITVDDLKAALALQKVTLRPGDAILIHTGWGQLYGKDNARLLRSEPGLGVAAGEWLAKQDPMLVGADTNALDVMPNPDPELSVPVHQILLAMNGVHILENLKLDELARLRLFTFAFTAQPLKLQGATGSTVAPAAIQ